MSGLGRSIKIFVMVAILLLLSPFSARGAERKPDLIVTYDPPRLSIEARGISLSRLLREIGAKVGFTVTGEVLSDTTITLSMERASLEDALKQLLRGKNHAIIYERLAQENRARISRVVLSRPTGHAVATRDHGEYRGFDMPAQNSGDRGGLTHVTTLPSSHRMTPPNPVARQQRESMPKNSEEPEIRADDVLRLHALSSLGGATAGIPPESFMVGVNRHPTNPIVGRGGAMGGVPTNSHLANTSEALAQSTLLAQQNLKALVDGLATATNSLLNSSLHNQR